MNGLLRRGPRLASARATSSLPVPLSPSMSTVLLTGAICSTFTITSRNGSLSPMSPVISCNAWRSTMRRTPNATSSTTMGLLKISMNPSERRRSYCTASSPSISPTTGVPAHSSSRTSAIFAESVSSPLITMSAGLARLISARMSSSGLTSTVCTPSASSLAFSRTAGSTSCSVMSTVIL